MDLKEYKGIIKKFISKNKYILIVAFIGIIIIVWPKSQESKKIEQVSSQIIYSLSDEEKKLEKILKQASGVGDVNVALTLKSSTEVIYAVEKDTSYKDNSYGKDENQTVSYITVNGNNGEEMVVVKYVYPEYLGAIIVCQGADNPSVALKITDAVSNFTGLSSDKITIIRKD